MIDAARIRLLASAFPERVRDKILKALDEDGVVAAERELRRANDLKELPHPFVSGGKVKRSEQVFSSPQEACGGSMTPPPDGFRRAWRPNNYRREVSFFKRVESASLVSDSTLHFLSRNAKRSFSPSNKLVFVKLDENITLQCGPHKLVCIWSQLQRGKKKATYFIEGDSEPEFQEKVKELTEAIRGKMDAAITLFLDVHKVKASEPSWARHEDWVAGEEVIDSLPDDLIFYCKVGKKVYGKGYEFTGGRGVVPGTRMGTYFENRGLEKISPELASAWNVFAVEQRNLAESMLFLNPYACVIKSVGDARSQKEAVDALIRNKGLVFCLKEEERAGVMQFLFQQHGG